MLSGAAGGTMIPPWLLPSLPGLAMGAAGLYGGAQDRAAAGNIATGNLQWDILSAILNQQNQQTAWQREDTAVQRRTADLKAAGLSPVLAAGSAAQSSGPMMVRAPQQQGNLNNRAQTQQMAIANATNVAQTLTGLIGAHHQQRLTGAQATKEEAKAALAEAYAASELEQIRQTTSSSKTKQAMDALEYDYMKRTDHRMPSETNISNTMKDIIRVLGDDTLDDLSEKLTDKQRERMQRLKNEGRRAIGDRQGASGDWNRGGAGNR